ncbi:uncharacterized protein BDV17DRAFT_266304 [Aspergillus undulatus]|uniref:uncharacterized protein n=1 Tax=Aspergillus undulatus TaxID=1810928 RepID=UPI003CCD4AE4
MCIPHLSKGRRDSERPDTYHLPSSACRLYHPLRMYLPPPEPCTLAKEGSRHDLYITSRERPNLVPTQQLPALGMHWKTREPILILAG